MDCCNVNGLNEIFNKTRAAKESRKYLRKGLDRRATMVVGCLRDQGVSGASILGMRCWVPLVILKLVGWPAYWVPQVLFWESRCGTSIRDGMCQC